MKHTTSTLIYANRKNREDNIVHLEMFGNDALESLLREYGLESVYEANHLGVDCLISMADADNLQVSETQSEKDVTYMRYYNSYTMNMVHFCYVQQSDYGKQFLNNFFVITGETDKVMSLTDKLEKIYNESMYKTTHKSLDLPLLSTPMVD